MVVIQTATKPSRFAHFFDTVRNPLPLPHETTYERPNVVRTSGDLRILTWKCASRHNGVHFFDIGVFCTF